LWYLTHVGSDALAFGGIEPLSEGL
jgi:hypothetical protein